LKAFVVATGLAAIALFFRDRAIAFAANTVVDFFVLDATFEKTLAA
jgi:hypothetical protein